MKPAHAPMPPARMQPLSDGLGYTCAGADPEPEPAADPVERGEPSAHQDPGPVHPAEPAQEGREVVAVEQGGPEPGQRGQQRDLEAAEEELRGEESGHGRRKDRRPATLSEAKPPPETIPKPALPLYFRPWPIPSSASSTLARTTCRASPSTCPHRALTVVTGPSGSGKSTLAFDTLYAEGQRRYIESLSTYAKQFLERMPKPLVDRLEGLAPSVAIEQRNPVGLQPLDRRDGHRGLRLPPPALGPDRPELLPRVRRRRSGGTRPSRRPTPSLASGVARVQIAFPLPPIARLAHAAVVENLRALGFVRVIADGDAAPSGRAARRSLDLTRAARAAGRRGPPRLPTPEALRADLARRSPTAFQEGEGVALGGSTTADGSGSPARPPAAAATRPPPRSPRRSSPSTTRAAPAPPATASARCWSTTSR